MQNAQTGLLPHATSLRAVQERRTVRGCSGRLPEASWPQGREALDGEAENEWDLRQVDCFPLHSRAYRGPVTR